ncbi:YqcC family protein [Actinobacillus minor]|uniref:YqcC-like domain-containing protein n=1 Tax=Actinobacillus minor NM305 TaxID=637911 RepID=C5S389_9PAST|nr:YqcC family protein [Actinobacillus minor]EER46549.1 hypothetical protein AM305_11715 [Actinobacillus minor NM305]MDD6910060.1 YqcC family protein [Actinobacillus minor]MDY4713407.1 YqcC family protein [Actinobacillus minor]
MKTKVKQLLIELQEAMHHHQLWEATPPSAEALANNQPFCVETLTPTQWLQWIFIPRMHALLEQGNELPRNFSITAYLEESLKNEPYLRALHQPLSQMEALLKS